MKQRPVADVKLIGPHRALKSSVIIRARCPPETFYTYPDNAIRSPCVTFHRRSLPKCDRSTKT